MPLAFVLNLIVGAVFAVAVAWAILWALTRVAPYLRFKGAFPELTQNAAGERARTELRATERDLLLLAAAAAMALTTVFALGLLGAPRLSGLWMWVLFGLACALIAAWWVFLVRGFMAWRLRRYAARSSIALAGALGRLALQGHRVFHDVPCGGLTVDHV